MKKRERLTVLFRRKGRLVPVCCCSAAARGVRQAPSGGVYVGTVRRSLANSSFAIRRDKLTFQQAGQDMKELTEKGVGN